MYRETGDVNVTYTQRFTSHLGIRDLEHPRIDDADVTRYRLSLASNRRSIQRLVLSSSPIPSARHPSEVDDIEASFQLHIATRYWPELDPDIYTCVHTPRRSRRGRWSIYTSTSSLVYF